MPVDPGRRDPARRHPEQRGPLAGLALACHPGPVVAVTLIAALLAHAAGAGARTTSLVAAAFLAGQLSVGWSNDWVDAARDTSVARADKPVAAGWVNRATVGRAAVVAAVATVPLSLALGPRAGLAHVVAVASAWTYNVVLKGTLWSWAPYALSFGLLPAVVTLALPDHPWPPAWVTFASALLGVGAHLVNVLPDLADDAATGVRGLPHRLGRMRTSLLAPAVLVAASALVVLGPPQPPVRLGWLALAFTAVVAALGALAALGGGSRRLPLLATVVVALVDVVLLVSSGSSLTP